MPSAGLASATLQSTSPVAGSTTLEGGSSLGVDPLTADAELLRDRRQDRFFTPILRPIDVLPMADPAWLARPRQAHTLIVNNLQWGRTWHSCRRS